MALKKCVKWETLTALVAENIKARYTGICEALDALEENSGYCLFGPTEADRNKLVKQVDDEVLRWDIRKWEEFMKRYERFIPSRCSWLITRELYPFTPPDGITRLWEK